MLLHHHLMQLDETRPILLIKLKHQIKDIADIVSIPVPQPGNSRSHQLFPIILLRLLVEASDVLHYCQLVEEETHRENI